MALIRSESTTKSTALVRPGIYPDGRSRAMQPSYRTVQSRLSLGSYWYNETNLFAPLHRVRFLSVPFRSPPAPPPELYHLSGARRSNNPPTHASHRSFLRRPASRRRRVKASGCARTTHRSHTRNYPALPSLMRFRGGATPPTSPAEHHRAAWRTDIADRIRNAEAVRASRPDCRERNSSGISSRATCAASSLAASMAS